ncbi:hypothetical protein [Eggerthella sp. HGA1]|uniref:hypothetical protein n=1 Tax=Eggerthella sp. HGA1 TaxID=910311 RepID=UPI0001FD70A6|nr:hypothetical protein [Eggerthella sp. HGA1]EGC88174.1 hypothetical protein HMPREF9404_3991 [Eggerthella sp. HGA1]
MATRTKTHHRPLAKTAALLASLLLASSLASTPVEALADGRDRIVKTFTYMEGEGEPEELVPPSIQHDGVDYKLEKKGEPRVDDTYERKTAELASDVTVEVQASEIGAAGSYLPAAVDASTVDPLYEGELPLDSMEQTPVYQLRTRQVDRPVDYAGLPTNDVDATIPAYGDFAVTSGEAPDATTTKTLALSDVEFEVEATDELGLPTSYTAHANYRGTEDYLETVAYTVTGHYKGIVTEKDGRMALDVTYFHEDPPAPEAAAPAPEPEPEQRFDALPYVVGAGAAGAVLIAVAVVWRRRARITKTFDDGSVVVLARVKATKTGDGAWSVRVPDRLERGPKELRPTQRMMRFRSIAITRDGIILRESAPAKSMQFDDGEGEATLQEV